MGPIWIRCTSWKPQPGRFDLYQVSRGFRCAGAEWSGHSRWSKIKHDKGKEDALKSKARMVLSHQVYLASKLGGASPEFNSQLAAAIANAKKGALSKSSIDAAIAKGQGKTLSGATLDSVTIEAILPFSVAAVIECQTDQKARTLQDVRYIVTKHGGTITPINYLFQKRGRTVFQGKDGIGPDEIMEEAIEAGALDVGITDDGQITVDTVPSAVSRVTNTLGQKFDLLVESSGIVHEPNHETMVTLQEHEAQGIESIIERIEEEPSVQDVYINAN